VLAGFLAALLAILTPVLSADAAHSGHQGAYAFCMLGVPLSADDCDRLLRKHARPRVRSWFSGSSAKTLAYASEPFAGAVHIWTVRAKGFTPVGELNVGGSYSYPFGLTVDDARNLYVAVGSYSSSPTPSVEVFPRGATKPSKIYTQGLLNPIDVAVDRSGTLYVANWFKSSCHFVQNDGSVVEYAKGSLTPTAVLTKGILGCPIGVAVDSNQNLYVTYSYLPQANARTQSDVLEYAYHSGKGVSKKGVRLHLTVPDGRSRNVKKFSAIAVDDEGDLVVENSQPAANLVQLLTFARGSKTPTSTVAYGGDWFPGYFALNKSRLLANAYLAEGLYNVMAEFDYPSGRQLFVSDPRLVAPTFLYGFALSP
jgi:hypothetical protein